MNRSLPDRATDLSVQQMRTFCGVYEHGGYASAERHLGLTVPTMWEQIKSLEKIYRVELFERRGRNIRPTQAGHLLFRLLTPMLANLESSFEILAQEFDGAPREVRVVTGVRMMLEELGRPLRRFRDGFPNVVLKLSTADNRTAQQDVRDGRVDLALLIEPPRERLVQGLLYQRLYPIEYLAVMPARHRLARKPAVALAELIAEPLIVGNPDTVGRQLLEQAVFRLGLTDRLQISIETDNSAVTVACVRAGMGIGIIAGRPRGNLTRHVAARSLARDIGHVHVVAASRSGRVLTRELETLLQLIKETARAAD